MAGITLDTGALIAIERGDHLLGAYLRLAYRRSRPLVVPAPVLAQVWRGSQNARIAQFLGLVFVEPMSARLAREAGELLGRAGLADVVDAAVVVGAASRGDEIVTGDMEDISRLASFVRGVGPIRDLSRLPRS